MVIRGGSPPVLIVEERTEEAKSIIIKVNLIIGKLLRLEKA